MLSKAAKSPSDGASRAGFLLTEVLVALVVAGLFLAVLSRAFAFAWGVAHVPGDVMSGMIVARAAVADQEADRDSGQVGRFSYVRTFGSATMLPRPPRIAPAPLGTGPPDAGAKARPDAPPLRLRSISVLVKAPFGRRLSLETVRLDAPPQ